MARSTSITDSSSAATAPPSLPPSWAIHNKAGAGLLITGVALAAFSWMALHAFAASITMGGVFLLISGSTAAGLAPVALIVGLVLTILPADYDKEERPLPGPPSRAPSVLSSRDTSSQAPSPLLRAPLGGPSN